MDPLDEEMNASVTCPCGTEFEYEKVGRGPIRKKCDACRTAPQGRANMIKRLTSQEIVDRLELSLKSRGTHISQNQEDY